MTNKRTRWTKDLVVETIKQLKHEGTPLHASFVMANNSKLYGAARKHLKSWKDAVETAGYKYDEVNLRSSENKWSQDLIVSEIKRLFSEGESLNSDYIQKNFTKLHSAAQRYYDSWGDAVNDAGFNYEEIKGIKWTKSTVIEEILKLNAQQVNLSSSEMQNTNMPLFQAGCRIYKSWKDAVNASGLDYNEYRKQKEWTPENVLEEIRNYIEQNGPISAGVVSKEYGALYQAARRNFRGYTWKEIVDLATKN